jgi:hypothetical protein
LTAAALARRLPALAIVVATVSVGTRAQAQDYPWCANFADGAGTNCGFTTYQQCVATIRGSGGFCAQNDWYKPPVAAAPAPRRAHKIHSREPS